jgi:hypothetical protein
VRPARALRYATLIDERSSDAKLPNLLLALAKKWNLAAL